VVVREDKMYYHAIAVLSGDRKKSIVNKSESQMLTEIVLPYVSSGTISAKWGDTNQSYQLLELRVYKTVDVWNKKTGQTLDSFLSKKPNIFTKFRKLAEKALGKAVHRVFVIMPIQGEKYGTQNDQRIYKEFDDRFNAIEQIMPDYQSVAIRIDKEHPLEDLVARIKSEIDKAQFIIADLTDERPSCYYEAGYAEARHKPIIYVASKESVIAPPKATKIHFDVHMNVNFFASITELKEKLKLAIDKNEEILFQNPKEGESIALAEAVKLKIATT
jgi:nucleoside 2-deoxyribosyltransferase